MPRAPRPSVGVHILPFLTDAWQTCEQIASQTRFTYRQVVSATGVLSKGGAIEKKAPPSGQEYTKIPMYRRIQPNKGPAMSFNLENRYPMEPEAPTVEQMAAAVAPLSIDEICDRMLDLVLMARDRCQKNTWEVLDRLSEPGEDGAFIARVRRRD